MVDVFPQFTALVTLVFAWLNSHGFIFAGVFITFWNIFEGGVFISLAGTVVVNLLNTGKGN